MSNRLAVIALKALKETNDEFEIGEVAKKYGASEFESRLISYAAHWSNDLIDACFNELGIEQMEGAFNSETQDAYMKWFEKTIDGLSVE